MSTAKDSCNRVFSMEKHLHISSIQRISNSVLQEPYQRRVRFDKINTEANWLELGKFRLAGYQARKPYMMLELDDTGRDQFDQHGSVYAAWLDNKIVASIRLCAHPFESSRYIKHEQFIQLLGNNYRNEFLEWTRLLISPNVKIPNLLNGLLIYAGMSTLASSSYQQYFGYSTPLVKRLFSHFKITSTVLDFTIPHRGNHNYILFKGNFLSDFNHLQERR